VGDWTGHDDAIAAIKYAKTAYPGH